MKFTAEIDVMPLKALLDPQGKAVSQSMHNLGFSTIQNVRIGKHITLDIEADSKTAAEKQVKDACMKLLSNPIIESFEVTIQEA